MTDIDAIRKRASERVNTVLASQDRRALLAAYDAKCEELAAAEQDAEDERAQLRRHCGCEFEDVEVAERPRIAICLPHLAVERERDAAVRDAQRYRWLRDAIVKKAPDRSSCEAYIEIGNEAFSRYDDEPKKLDARIDAHLVALAPPTEQQKVAT